MLDRRPDPRLIRPHECFRCGEGFKLGDRFYSDAPGIVYHFGCYRSEIKDGQRVRSTSNPTQE